MNFLCKYFDVSRSGYYAWIKRSKTIKKNKLEELIAMEFALSKGTYGSPRISEALKRKGVTCSENTVAKKMKQMGLKADRKKKFKIMPSEVEVFSPIAPRIFKSGADKIFKPKEVYVGDITYLPFKNKFLYLSIVMDIATRKVVGWSLDDKLGSNGIINALRAAVVSHGKCPGTIFHSDQGAQYTSQEYRQCLVAQKMIPSMSRRGNCYDNAYAETFFKTLKDEFFYRNIFESETELRAGIFEYIEIWYNKKRLHSSLGYLSPVEYELKNKITA